MLSRRKIHPISAVVSLHGLIRGSALRLSFKSLSLRVWVFHLHPLVCVPPAEVKEVIGVPGTGGTGICKPPCGCWGLNPGLLEEQMVFLTTEPSLLQ